jgi:predicted ATPase/class 3 adenylate cyclase
MVAQPTGTVTLLFTDIEGSTRLLERLGPERYGAALDRHRRLLREAFERHDGYEVDHEGDAFFIAFASADEAVAAATEAQQALAAAEWGEALEFRVRMGIHTGEPLAAPPKYVGLDVHKAARIMAAGHGSQVLLSESTRRLLHAAEVVGLGEHRLKDLLQPEPLYQLRIEGLPSEFPTLKTLGNQPNNLPPQPNALIGREEAVAEVVTLLREEAVRLVTLTGPGGTGKTRLALQVGAEIIEHFGSGVFFVSLAPVGDPAMVIPAVAQALAVRELAGEELADTLAAYLEQKQMLLILDNFEQVIAAGSDLAMLSRRCPSVKLLVTSRERLRLSSERTFPVPPLVLADPAEGVGVLLRNDAVALFAARAADASEDFVLDAGNASVVAEICARLDGLPLAIELAAARTGALTPPALLRRLDQRLQLLTVGSRDADERQRTLRDTIAWSYELLNQPEQALFASLSVFVDGCRLEAVEAVFVGASGDDVLDLITSLLEKSLVRRRADADGEPRYWMLETIQEYAGERLAGSAESAKVRGRYVAHYLGFAVAANSGVTGPDQVSWLGRIRSELGNLRSVFRLLLDSATADDVLRLATALWRALWLSGYISEVREWLRLAIASDESGTAEALGTRLLRIEALRGAAFLAMWQGDYEEQSALAEEALVLARTSGATASLASSLLTAGSAARSRSDYAAAEPLLEESLMLARESGDTRAVCMALGNLATLYRTAGQLDRARQTFQESLPLIRSVGDRYGTASALFGIAFVAIEEGHADEASPHLEEALALSNELDYREGIGYFLQGAAGVAAASGDAERAAIGLGCMRALHSDLGFKPNSDDERLNAHTADTARKTLGEEAFQAALAVGSELPLKEALVYVTSETVRRARA